MPRPKNTSPTDRELDILQVLWQVESASLSEIREALIPRQDLAPSTIATMLGLMADKRLVRRTADRRWVAVVSRAQASRGLMDRLLNSIFEGSTSRLVAHVVESHPLDKQEIDELQRMLDEYRAAQGSNGKNPK
jgi:predicted transcriptional regulator